MPTMKTSRVPLVCASALWGGVAAFAQDAEPTPPVPALESLVNLQIVLTTTGSERVSGPPSARVATAKFDVTRMNTRGFVELLNERHALVAQPRNYTLVAVLAETEEESGYRFYLKNTRKNAPGPAYVYLSPEVMGLSIDASAFKYREVQNGDVLTSSRGNFKHAVTLDSAGFATRGIASGGYTLRTVRVGDVSAALEVPSAMRATTSGYFVEDEGTEEAQTFIAETRWTFTAGKPVDLNKYPAPPPPSELPGLE